MNKPALRLKQLRLDMGLTQTELGDKLGVIWYLIKNIETEKTKLSIEVAEALYKNLNVNINWILSGEGNRFIDEKDHFISPSTEEAELAPEFKEIVYELKGTTDKIIELNKKFTVREDKVIYRISSDREKKKKYPLTGTSSAEKDMEKEIFKNTISYLQEKIEEQDIRIKNLERDLREYIGQSQNNLL